MISKKAELDYSKYSPNQWSSLIHSAKSLGLGFLSVPVFWGAHEKLQGVRDFSKSSRLRLERVLSLAANQDTRIRLRVGFFPDERTFPQWTEALSERALVPSGLWENSLGTLSMYSVPSLLSEQLRQGFLGFLEEVLSLVALYQVPDGPIEKVEFTWGLYQADLNLIELSRFSESLKARYHDIQHLNLRYQTLFRDFDSVATRSGLRTLFDKRAWLAAWDFKNARQLCLESFRSSLTAVATAKELSNIFSFEPGGSDFSKPNSWALAMDDTLIEASCGKPLFPLTAGGQITLPCVQAFRLAELLYSQARQFEQELRFLDNLELANQAALCVVSGRYLSSKAHGNISALLEAGGVAFFPFGVPQFNENLEAVSFSKSREKSRGIIEGEEFFSLQSGNGRIFYPAQEWIPQKDSFLKIQRVMGEISRAN